ncbi:hypothetical protein B0H13DRAFT_1875071 [Mycena leptocephala]|nr:hypothetical protein B0H13DRAFT_1875071 [Mycena leptocephala]
MVGCRITPKQKSFEAYLPKNLEKRATFLAAVQSQIVALSYQENSTRLRMATNVLGFAGVLLDIIAACFALLASTILQTYIAVVEKQIDAIEDASPAQIASLRPLPRTVSADVSRRALAQIKERRAALERLLTDGHDSGDNIPLINRTSKPAELLDAIPESWKQIRSAVPLGAAAGSAMFLGILASVECLAISTQPPAVWIVSA